MHIAWVEDSKKAAMNHSKWLRILAVLALNPFLAQRQLAFLNLRLLCEKIIEIRIFTYLQFT